MDIRTRAIAFLQNLTNNRDLPGAASLMHDSLILQHNDLPLMTKAEFVDFWLSVLEQSLNICATIKDVICEGHRVWVFSCVTGRLNEGPLDDVYMLAFAPDGRVL